MLIIRLSRVGKKSHAQYKVVLAEKTYPVKGKFNEILGSYDPHQKKAVLKQDRINYWIEKGVTCSDTAWNLLVANNIVEGAKRRVKVPAKKVEEKSAEAKSAVAPVAEAKTEEAPVEAKVEEAPVAETKEAAPAAEEATPQA